MCATGACQREQRDSRSRQEEDGVPELKQSSWHLLLQGLDARWQDATQTEALLLARTRVTLINAIESERARGLAKSGYTYALLEREGRALVVRRLRHDTARALEEVGRVMHLGILHCA